MAAVAGARRTQSAYPAFLRSTNPSDLVVPTAVYGLTSPTTGYDPAILQEDRRTCPTSSSVATSGNVNNALAARERQGASLPPKSRSGQLRGRDRSRSINGLYVDQDRVTITAGRMVDPSRANEMLVSPPVAKVLGIHVGTVLHFGFYTNAQEAAPGPSGDQYRPHPYLRMDDQGGRHRRVQQHRRAGRRRRGGLELHAVHARAHPATHGVLHADDRSPVSARPRQPRRAGRGSRARHSSIPCLGRHVYVASVDEAKAERAIEPESIALGVFGLIAALAALLIAAQVIGRQLRAGADELDVAARARRRPAMTTADGLIGVTRRDRRRRARCRDRRDRALAARADRRGPQRVPVAGIAFDWTVLGLGALAAGRRARRDRGRARVPAGAAPRRTTLAPHDRRADRRRRAPVAGLRLSAPAATGVRFALEPGRGRNAVPVRSAILGAALAIVVVVSTLTFGASLHTLVSRPALYGWNWDYELSGGGGVGNIPQQLAAKALDARPRRRGLVRTRTSARCRSTGIVGPGVRREHERRRRSAAAVGSRARRAGTDRARRQHARAAAQAHRRHRRGQHRREASGHACRSSAPRRCPRSAAAEAAACTWRWAPASLFPYQDIPPALRDVVGNKPTGPNAILVRFRTGVNRSAALPRTRTRSRRS